ncbi:hypothetical protein DENSPDRAFT_407555 [Dentipellis sp. KUC8613]|nr:hypothetical protein DENSPDRAFT_407555 [Dentipellis sp. KUC8613]
MYYFPPPMPVNVPQRTLPRRTDSLNVPLPNAQLFVTIDEELRDSMRVQRQGQEEDLREALSRMMVRVEELCALLKSTYQTNSDLETSLTLAQSNLKLALANNEMLEDALRRNSSSKDVGWRRSSRETSSLTHTPPAPSAPAPSPVSRTSLDEEKRSLDSPDVENAASPSQDSRFFRFRFSSGRSTPTQGHSPPPQTKSILNGVRSPVVPSPGVSHLTSASLPSLLPGANTKELDDLKVELEAERSKLEKIVGEKRSLEGELESLSQALFEEVRDLISPTSLSLIACILGLQANKMVASERIKRAEAEEELRQTRAEKDALRSALKILESENGQLRSQPHPEVNGAEMTHSRSSSTAALKSPVLSDTDTQRNGSSSRPTSPSTGDGDGYGDIPTAVPELTAPLDPASAPDSPAPLYVPPPHARLAETESPDSRTSSPLPLPHPHLPSHLRSALASHDSDGNESDADSVGRAAAPTPPPLRTSTARTQPSAPPPSAADSAASAAPWGTAGDASPWGSAVADEGDVEEDEDEDEDDQEVVVLRNKPTPYSPPPQALRSPWAD